MSETSQLVYSDKLGRHLRTGSAASLGVSTTQLAVEALADGRPADAAAYVPYLIGETERIYGIFCLWLTELRAYAEQWLPEVDAHYQRIAVALGCEPPMQQSATLSEELLAACSTAIETADCDALARHLAAIREELRRVHDAQAEWCWALLTLLRDELGEDRMDDVLRKTEEEWVTARYAALSEMTPRELFELTIEGMRGHLTGPDRMGEIQVTEDDEKFVLSFDPCGSGGRMRRGDAVRGQPPAAERPGLFGATNAAHDWSWNEEGVCLYCAHCAVVNEILPIERIGSPMRVTEHPASAEDPCRWTIYKSPGAVPDEAYRRVGKPAPGRPSVP